MAGRKNRSFFVIFALIVGLGGFFSVFMFSCETESAVVNLAIKQDGETYLFSALGSFIVDIKLKENESPSAFGFIQLFEDDGLFVAPKSTEQIANLLAGNYDIFPYQEKSYEGYITAGSQEVYSDSYKNVSTETIGEQIREYTAEITHPTSGNIFEIIWEWNPKTSESKALKNCELKSFWITTFVQPGESTTTSNDFIMVDLAHLVNFFDNGSSLEYSAEEEILYIIEN